MPHATGPRGNRAADGAADRRMARTEWTVDAAEAGVRLDRYLAAATRLGSRTRAASAIARGKVFLNVREVARAASAAFLNDGDRVRVWIDRPGSARRRPSPFPTGAIR